MSLPSMILHSPYSSDRLVQLAARLWPTLCDALISVGSQEFPAHSLVLAGASQQLGHGGRWALAEGVSPSTFAQLLHFVYGESVELQPDELGPLEEAARVLGVQALEKACRKAQRNWAKEVQDPGLKTHQESGKYSKDSKRELGDLAEKQTQGFFRVGGKEEELSHKHRPPRGSLEVTGAMPQVLGEQIRSKEGKLSQFSTGHQGADGKPGVVMWLRESPGGPVKSSWEAPGSLPLSGSPQANIIPRPWRAEASWVGKGQPSRQSILLLPPRFGTPFSHSTPITGAWQELWPWNQRIPLPLNLQKGLWSQNPWALSSPTPGKHLLALHMLYTGLGVSTLSSSDSYVVTGSTATYEDRDGRVGCLSREHSPLFPPVRARPYSCLVCGKRFSLKHQMETHHRVHTGEKPFSCSLCPQRSRDFSAMTKHLRTHGASPYRCSLCQAGCPSLASMQAHMRSHPPSQLPPGWTIRSTFLYSSSSGSSRASTSPSSTPPSTT
ncbi:PREDICTED: zinc finger and BTB domain-containing protein 32 [Elephantulus edwardii]|uniref:zinc finger and BTB domain-containing protein 32 n=1 Tax=Elephantulus edwardii TaxID=28737 RepID=UPI0003F0E80B|nr:PREDICTED: zinc finger and BTB domain-containing protein 32 [Elephantulus edwardii]